MSDPSAVENKPKREREEITLETVVPEVPKKGQRVAKPVYEDLVKQLKQVDEQIANANQKMKIFIQDVIQGVKNQREKNKESSLPVREVFQNLLVEQKLVKKEFFDIKDQTTLIKKLLEEKQGKAAQLKQKIKKIMSKTQLEEEIKESKERLHNQKITMAEEKSLIKYIDELEKSLPLVGPLDELETEIKSLLSEKKTLTVTQNDKWSQLQALEAKITEAKSSLNLINDNPDEKSKDINPVIDEKRSETEEKIQALKESKKLLKDTYYQNLKLYNEQQDVIQRADFILKIKAKLLRQAEREKILEQERLDALEEEKSLKLSPNKEQIDLCKLLISYCERLQPQKAEQDEKIQQVDQEQIQQKLNGKEWKKDNVTVVQTKVKIDEQVGKKKKQFKKQENNQVQNLVHRVDVIEYFDAVKIVPPLQTSQIENVINELKFKIQYYQTSEHESIQKEKPTTKKVVSEKPVLKENDFPTL